MTWTEAILLVVAGLFTGAVNTLAGGGSLITLPLLIFMGLPSAEANATNRIGVLLQSVTAVGGFRSKGVSAFPFAIWVSLTALAGCLIGVQLAVEIRSDLFNRVLAVVMVVVMVLTVWKPKTSVTQGPSPSHKSTGLSLLIFFFIGIYGGFIQAGVGFLMIAALTGIQHFDLAKTNSIKSVVVVSYTLLAVVLFWQQGLMRWDYGLVLAAGGSAGSWLAARWSVGKDDKWIRLILILTVVGLAVKLWFF